MKIGNAAALEAALSVINVPQSIKENEFTIYQASEKTGMSHKTVAGQLKEAVRTKKVSVRKVLVGGKWMNAYSVLPTVAKQKPAKKSVLAR